MPTAILFFWAIKSVLRIGQKEGKMKATKGERKDSNQLWPR